MDRKHLLLGVLGSTLLWSLFLGVWTPDAQARASASAGLHWVRGYSVQSGWLCYGWPTFYHCTSHWTLVDGRYLSYNAPFVPSQSTQSTQSTPVSSPGPSSLTTGQPCHTAVLWPRTISAWAVPLGCYGGIYRPSPAAYVPRPSYGWCNWWPEVLHPWLSGYAALHQPGHSSPRVSAVVFFAPGVQGASRAGHYAQVVAVAPGGYWLLITEMNFYYRGGGFARVDYRYVHVGAGVSFRY